MRNIIGNRHIFLTVSALFIGAAMLCVVVFGFRQGIEFTGGTLWEFSTETSTDINKIQELFAARLGASDPRVTVDPASGHFLVRLPATSEEEHRRDLGILAQSFAEFQEFSFQSIGPSIGSELRKNAFMAIVLVLVGISLYIAFAFRKVSRPVSSWKYGFITLFTLFHDIIIPAGLLAILGHYAKIEIDTNFIVALLVVAGFSVHDTIVVFDRIRENLFMDRGKTPFGTLINQSVNQTLGRSVNTSLTLILVLLALYFTGPVHLRYFVLTLVVGVTTGIYSSIFVASPLLLVIHRKRP